MTDSYTASNIPDAHCFIKAAGREHGTISIETDAENKVGMANQGLTSCTLKLSQYFRRLQVNKKGGPDPSSR